MFWELCSILWGSIKFIRNRNRLKFNSSNEHSWVEFDLYDLHNGLPIFAGPRDHSRDSQYSSLLVEDTDVGDTNPVHWGDLINRTTSKVQRNIHE